MGNTSGSKSSDAITKDHYVLIKYPRNRKKPKFIYYKDSGQLKEEEDGKYKYYPDTSSSESETLERATQIQNGRQAESGLKSLVGSDTKIKYKDLEGKEKEAIAKKELLTKNHYIDLEGGGKADIKIMNMYYVLKKHTTIIGVITEMGKSVDLAEAREKTQLRY